MNMLVTNKGGDQAVIIEPTEIAGVWKLLFNHPPVNAMSMSMYRAVISAIDELEARDEITCVLIGSLIDGGFCAGADRNELASLTNAEFSLENWEEREKLSQEFFRRLENFAVPTIAVVDGYAIGAGFVIASVCDLRFASDRTWFSIPELKNVSRLGGAAHAIRVLPQAIARAMYFQGSRLDAASAKLYGMLNGVVSVEELWSVALDAAKQISSQQPHALRLAKRALNLGQDEPIVKSELLERQYSFRLAAAEKARGTSK